MQIEYFSYSLPGIIFIYFVKVHLSKCKVKLADEIYLLQVHLLPKVLNFKEASLWWLVSWSGLLMSLCEICECLVVLMLRFFRLFWLIDVIYFLSSSYFRANMECVVWHLYYKGGPRLWLWSWVICLLLLGEILFLSWWYFWVPGINRQGRFGCVLLFSYVEKYIIVTQKKKVIIKMRNWYI